MTIIVVAKIDDGLVISSDSTTSMRDNNGLIMRTYHNAEKLLNLYQGFPVALATWGAGSIDAVSIATLAKELNQKFMSDDKQFRLIPKQYTIDDIATKTHNFFAEKLERNPVYFGFFIAGYSAKTLVPDVYKFEVKDGKLNRERKLDGHQIAGIEFAGEYGAVLRLLKGTAPIPEEVAARSGIDIQRFVEDCKKLAPYLQAHVMEPSMPLKDAVDVVEFLVQTQIQYCRFAERDQTVGGAIDIAIITRYEGFNRIKKKSFTSN